MGTAARIVVQLTGFPFVEGTASVFRLSADGSYTAVATGLKTLVDVEVAADGSLLVCSAGDFDPATGQPAPGTGSVIRVRQDGSYDTFIGGLWLPTGVEVIGDDAVRLSVRARDRHPLPRDRPPALPRRSEPRRRGGRRRQGPVARLLGLLPLNATARAIDVADRPAGLDPLDRGPCRFRTDPVRDGAVSRLRAPARDRGRPSSCSPSRCGCDSRDGARGARSGARSADHRRGRVPRRGRPGSPAPRDVPASQLARSSCFTTNPRLVLSRTASGLHQASGASWRRPGPVIRRPAVDVDREHVGLSPSRRSPARPARRRRDGRHRRRRAGRDSSP